MAGEKDCLDEKIRAEDILLGSLGFDCDAKIIDVALAGNGYRGHAKWSDDETFEFESEDEMDDLERWAVSIIQRTANKV